MKKQKQQHPTMSVDVSEAIAQLGPPQRLEDFIKQEENCEQFGEPGHACQMGFIQPCHPDAGLGVFYRSGVIYMFCLDCYTLMTGVAVADRVGMVS